MAQPRMRRIAAPPHSFRIHFAKLSMEPIEPMRLDRRQFATASSVALAAAMVGANNSMAAPSASPSLAHSERPLQVKYCLNTSTIHGEVVPVVEQVAIAKEAGYDAIEFWLRDIDKYLAQGGTLGDLKKRIQDAGLTVESSIAFAPWIVEDEAQHKKALEQARKEMDTIVAIGGKRIAAPPAGATNGAPLNLDIAADRYRALLEVGASAACIPQLEVWGFSKNLSRLSEVLYVAAAAQHPDACVLPDIYHLYKGGSLFHDLGLLSGKKIHVFHVNDYPDIPREKINDSDRVYPGDGIAPGAMILKTVANAGFHGVLSLELFNPEYWKQDPRAVAKTGLMKTKALVEKANSIS